MPGNQDAKGRPARNLKGGSQLAPDVKALSGAETFGSEMNMQLFGIEGEDYGTDIDFGLPSRGLATENTEDTQGNSGFAAAKPLGKPHPGNRTRPKRGDPHSGGGW